MVDTPHDDGETTPTVTQTGEFDGPRRIAIASGVASGVASGADPGRAEPATPVRHGRGELPAVGEGAATPAPEPDLRTTARHGTAERPSVRSGTAERPAVSPRAAARHGTAERRALSEPRTSGRHGSGERPRHGSGEREAVGDDRDELTIDGRVPWAVGDLISGRYEIERPLGGGSMGDVFLGEDRLLKKPVALKVLRPDLAENRDTVRRFLREVALAHSVTHQNVVRIYDTGEEKGLPFFTMEVLQGQVLDELLEGPDGAVAASERMPIKKIRSIAFDVLDAMEAAHRAGVVHRDLKPGNVMLTHRGAIVMDFGVAGIDDMLERGKLAPPSTTSLRSLVRTEVGTIFGSPAYMAPELWEGQAATVQSDLYAFGVMLYQMLTGRLPFSAKTPAAFVEKLSTAPPPPLRSLRRDVPWNLVRLVRRCMARDPEERPA
ncbi:MAG: protein kinase, partial [Myxococcota bacterium]